MKPSTKERAMRALLSSLIGSNLAPNEIREVSDAFQNDPKFCREIGVMINDILVRMDMVKQGQDHRISSIDSQSQDRFVSQMLSVVNKRRLSKRNLLAMIKLLLSESAFSQIKDDLTMAELLAAFKSSASQEQIERFKNCLQPSLNQPESDQASAVLSYIKKKSLSKEQVAAKLSSFLPQIADLIKADKFSLSEILKIFLKCATPDQIQAMMNFLRSDTPVYGDDYLKGIMKER